jgi:gluconate kinase
MPELPCPLPPSTPYIIILTGIHVTGKETIALSLLSSFHCLWLKGALIRDSGLAISRAQETRGEDLAKVYGQMWLKKMQRVGLIIEAVRPSQEQCVAVVSSYALRHFHRDAIRDVLLSQLTPVRAIFVILQIYAVHFVFSHPVRQDSSYTKGNYLRYTEMDG